MRPLNVEEKKMNNSVKSFPPECIELSFDLCHRVVEDYWEMDDDDYDTEYVDRFRNDMAPHVRAFLHAHGVTVGSAIDARALDVIAAVTLAMMMQALAGASVASTLLDQVEHVVSDTPPPPAN
jgi:hypothetical protein